MPPTRLGDGVAVVAAEQRLHRLQELTHALSGMLDAREVAAIVASRGRAAVGAVAVAVLLRHGDELELSGYEGYADEEIGALCRIPLDRDVPAAEAVRTGELISLSGDEVDARYPGLANWRRLAGRGPLLALPLVAEGRAMGSLAIRMPGERTLEDADRILLEVLARSCAQALHRAEYVEAEREARRSAEGANAVLDTIITTAPGGFALFDTEMRYVRVNDALARINGLPAADHIGRMVAEIVPSVAAKGSMHPLRRVLETGEPVLDLEVRGYTPADPEREHTWLTSYYPVRDGDGEIAWIGAFVVDITARTRAEERSAVLAELGSILDEVVSVEERLARLADALVPAVCDMCTVSLRGPDGALDRIAIRHVDPEAERVLAQLGAPDGAGYTGETRVVAEADDAAFDAYGVSAQDRERQRRAGVASGVTVPLVVRGRHIGVLGLGSTRPRAFGPAEVALAEEVARRAALAVDNAQLYESERLARERSQHQYAVAAALADALTAADVAAAVLEQVLPAIGADKGTVWQVSEDGTALEPIGRRGFADAETADHARVPLTARRPVADAIRARAPLWLESPEAIAAAYPEFGAPFRRAGIAAAAVFPLLSTGRAVGGLFAGAAVPRLFSPEDRALATALAAQAAQALERARLFEAERRVSVTLQRSLLPAALPEVDGLAIDVRYLPAAGLEAGGDFYEALPLPDGAVVLAVGDVVGRGATAAAAMGQLRSALRAFALVGEDPGAILTRLSAFADTVGGAMAATAVVAKLDPATGELRYACAGHPWPLLVHAGGRAEYLTAGRSVPLGCLSEPAFPEASVRLHPGSTLLVYTDGLTEQRGLDADTVLARMRDAAAAASTEAPGALLDRIIAAAGAAPRADDIALVAVRLTGPGAGVLRLAFPAEPARVPAIRARVRQWLEGLGAPREVLGDLLLAAGEAVANAVEHSGAAEVELELATPEAGVASITVRDRGTWREPVPAPHRGRGFALMRTLTDDLEVDRAEGTVVRMRRRLGGAEPAPAAAEPPPLRCTVAVEGGVAMLRGDLDLDCAREACERLLAAGARTVDLSGISYLDSTGARMLLSLRNRPGAPLVLVAPPGSPPRRTLDLSGLTGVLDVRDA